MSVSDMFKKFLENLGIDNNEQISNRYGEITCCLNKKYRDTESKTANSLKVGSYGRYTAIKGISDLDMLYIMPKSEWDRFKNERQSALLQEVKETIKQRYPKTDMRGDGQVVVVSFTNQDFEVVPAFEQDHGEFKYPNTKDGGSWRITNPRAEIKAISDMDNKKNKNLRNLCKMIRAWKNKHGVVMGGLLIDTLAYNFLNTTNYYDDKSYLYYDFMARDFFKYIAELLKQDYYLAPGSNQRVYVKKSFKNKAKKAYELCLEAIEAENKENVNKKWKKIFGRPFPDNKEIQVNSKMAYSSSYRWDNTEEFVEDSYHVDIKYYLKINCDVSQAGFRKYALLDMILKRIPLMPKHSLLFKIIENNIPLPYSIKWKVLNRGEIAKEKNQIRGEIINSNKKEHKERTLFRGDHYVECYIIKNNVVVARDHIDVPIARGE